MTTTEMIFAVLSFVGIIAYTWATFVIARYTKASHELAKELKRTSEAERERNQEYREQVSDLFQAIVVATLCVTPGGTLRDNAFRSFKEHYRGKTRIFDRDN